MSRGWTWVDEDVDHTPEQEAEAEALAQLWNEQHYEAEREHFRHLSDLDDPGYCDPDDDLADLEPEEAEKESKRRQAYRRLVREQKIEAEDRLYRRMGELGMRMMRAYEHWNEDEQYMQWQEEGRFGHYSD